MLLPFCLVFILLACSIIIRDVNILEEACGFHCTLSVNASAFNFVPARERYNDVNKVLIRNSNNWVLEFVPHRGKLHTLPAAFP